MDRREVLEKDLLQGKRNHHRKFQPEATKLHDHRKKRVEPNVTKEGEEDQLGEKQRKTTCKLLEGFYPD